MNNGSVFKCLTIYILLILLLAGESPGQNALTPIDIARLELVSDQKISEDGKSVAFLLRVPSDPMKENKPGQSHLYLHNLQSRNSIPYFTRGSVSSIDFRPGHSTITFLAKLGDEKHTSLYEVSQSGGEPTLLYQHSSSISSYSFSGNGEDVALVVAGEKKEADSALPYVPEIYEEGLVSNQGLIVNLDSKTVRNINLGAHFTGLKWSKSGDKLAAVTAATSRIDDVYMYQQLQILDSESLEVIQKVEREGKLGALAFNQAGTKLAYIGGADLNDPTDGRLWIFDLNSKKSLQVNPGFEGKFESFVWNEDGTIEFIASKGVWTMLGQVRSDGSGCKEIIPAGGPILSDLEKASDGTRSFLGETPEHPSEVYLLKEKEKQAQKLTAHNQWLTEKQLAPQEVLRYQARDGLEIEGILIQPLNMEEGKRYPLVTVVHGGPESHYSNGWLTGYSTVGQMGAGLGYAVFYPNYRGSTGRGEKFAKISQGDPAGAEFDDIVDGVDYLIEQGLVDKSKVGVTGGSYGGYATGWFATKYTDRFAAGVMFVGISDNISKWGTTDIPDELYLVHARKRIWEDYQFFLERSPIYYADQAKTPLLIMHGAEDTRVHPSQSIELYRHIKVRTDTPVRLVLYPGEGHGNRNATARLDYSLRQLRWFEKYLQNKDIELDQTVSLDLLK